MPMWNGLMVCLWTILSCRHHCSARQSQVSSLICRKCSILVLNRCCITVCFWVLVSYLEGWVVGWKNLAVASYLRCRCNVSWLWTAGTLFDPTEPWDQRTRKPSPDCQWLPSDLRFWESNDKSQSPVYWPRPWAGKNQVSQKKLIISQHSWAGSTTQVWSMKFQSRQQQVIT